jgi:predicted hotdog family 3-hydroxylacyl-ACP dehydratase
VSTQPVLPSLDELIPHQGPMRLLARVVQHADGRTVCTVDPCGSELFRDASGEVPAWVALEYMAQCVAAHGALLDREPGDAPRPGFLVGAKRVGLHRDALDPHESLEVSARILQRVGRLATLACEVRSAGELVAEGTLSVFVPDSIHAPARPRS